MWGSTMYVSVLPRIEKCVWGSTMYVSVLPRIEMCVWGSTMYVSVLPRIETCVGFYVLESCQDLIYTSIVRALSLFMHNLYWVMFKINYFRHFPSSLP